MASPSIHLLIYFNKYCTFHSNFNLKEKKNENAVYKNAVMCVLVHTSTHVTAECWAALAAPTTGSDLSHVYTNSSAEGTLMITYSSTDMAGH